MMNANDAVLVYSTCPDEATAREIGGALVGERMAACVNVIPGMRSIYRWEGEIAEDAEVVMIAKTRAALADDVTKAIIARHPYDTPAVIVLAAAGGSAEFLDWIAAETGEVV